MSTPCTCTSILISVFLLFLCVPSRVIHMSQSSSLNQNSFTHCQIQFLHTNFTGRKYIKIHKFRYFGRNLKLTKSAKVNFFFFNYPEF